jgi:hypothetical protein
MAWWVNCFEIHHWLSNGKMNEGLIHPEGIIKTMKKKIITFILCLLMYPLVFGSVTALVTYILFITKSSYEFWPIFMFGAQVGIKVGVLALIPLVLLLWWWLPWVNKRKNLK